MLSFKISSLLQFIDDGLVLCQRELCFSGIIEGSFVCWEVYYTARFEEGIYNIARFGNESTYIGG